MATANSGFKHVLLNIALLNEVNTVRMKYLRASVLWGIIKLSS